LILESDFVLESQSHSGRNESGIPIGEFTRVFLPDGITCIEQADSIELSQMILSMFVYTFKLLWFDHN